MPEPTPTPAEHCGHLAPTFGLTGQPDGGTECVLRPGHTGSHADEHGMRWRPIAPGPDPLREQYAEAIHATSVCEVGQPTHCGGGCADAADAALNVRDTELQQLREQLAHIARLADEHPVHIDTALVHAALDGQDPS